MTSSIRADWLIATGLVALSFIPVVAGGVRLLGLTSGAGITPDNARFFAAPVPVVLHIFSAAVYGVLGAFQFFQGQTARALFMGAGWAINSAVAEWLIRRSLRPA